MIRLTQPTSDLVSLITAQNGAKTVAAFTDTTATTWAGSNEVHSITSSTTTTIVATPAASTIREIDFINIYNTYAGAQLLTVQQSVSATLYILVAFTLLQGESLQYTHAGGWCALDVNGNRKEVTASVSISTRQVFLTGTAQTYTTPPTARKIIVRMKGGGGGGGGSGSTVPSASTGGGTTTFNSINANGGALGTTGSGSGSPGGTGGTGAASIRLSGSPGGVATTFFASATNGAVSGGNGGGTGAGYGVLGNNGVAGSANSGGGGSGGGLGSFIFATIAADYYGTGGGEGEYAEVVINTPSTTYTYTVGSGGNAGGAGTSGFVGGAGGSGFIVVDEFY